KENRELESLSHIVAELQRLQTHGILEEELEEVRSEYLRFIDTQQRHSAQLDPSYFTDCAMDAFYEDLLLLDFDKATALKRNIAENLTLERVHSMLDAYAPIPNSHVCLALPLAANADRIHQGELEAAWTSGIESAHTPPTRTPSPPLAPVELPAGTVDMETETCPHTGAETLTFSNGIRVTLYPMEDAPDHIRMKAMAKGGHACLSEPDSNAAVLANAWLAWAGIGGCRRQTLEKLLNGKEVSLERQIGATKRSIKGQCKMEELDEFLGLLHLLFSYKEEDEELFYFVQQRTAEFRKDLHRSPSRLFQYAVQALNSSGSPIMQELRTSDILGCRYENVQELAHAAFSRAADFHFTFSGDFDPDLIKPLLAEYLGKLPTRDESQRWAALSEEPQFPTHITTQSLEAGIDAKARLQISFPAPKDFEHRSLVERGLCAQILKKRLLQKLRFEDGVTYSVGVGLQYFLRPLSDYGTMGISLVCAPEDIDAVERSIIEALNELISEGCTESELEEVRQSWLIERARERSYAQKASNALTQYQMNHWDPSDHASVEDWAKELTLADVKQHLAVLLPLDNYTVMRQVPEARTDGA
ncbi:MAG: insulinase family protein, partial [Chlamydiia bacterium]|nr:insulinase family protein [Chlamydiia bacterium]